MLSAATSPRTVLVLITAVESDALNDVTVTYSVSSVTLHVWVSQKTCFTLVIPRAITQEEQLVLIERDEVIWLSDAVMVPREKDVVFAKEEFDEDGTDEARLDISMEGSHFSTYLIGPPRLRERPERKGIEGKEMSPSG